MNFDNAAIGLVVGVITLLAGVYFENEPTGMAGGVVMGICLYWFNRGLRGRLPKR